MAMKKIILITILSLICVVSFSSVILASENDSKLNSEVINGEITNSSFNYTIETAEVVYDFDEYPAGNHSDRKTVHNLNYNMSMEITLKASENQLNNLKNNLNQVYSSDVCFTPDIDNFNNTIELYFPTRDVARLEDNVLKINFTGHTTLDNNTTLANSFGNIAIKSGNITFNFNDKDESVIVFDQNSYSSNLDSSKVLITLAGLPTTTA